MRLWPLTSVSSSESFAALVLEFRALIYCTPVFPWRCAPVLCLWISSYLDTLQNRMLWLKLNDVYILDESNWQQLGEFLGCWFHCVGLQADSFTSTLLIFCCFSTEHTFLDLRRKSEFPLALVFCHCDKTPGEDSLEEFLWAHSLGVGSPFCQGRRHLVTVGRARKRELNSGTQTVFFFPVLEPNPWNQAT